VRVTDLEPVTAMETDWAMEKGSAMETDWVTGSVMGSVTAKD
jgi:hypothetical protein